MRYIRVERIDKTYGRTECDTYEFPNEMTNDDIATEEGLCDEFDNFVNKISTSTIVADGHSVEDYLENCEWWFYDLDEEEIKEMR